MAEINKDKRVRTTNDLELVDKLVAVNRVTKVTKGGRAFSFSAIVVVGDSKGVVGWGLGKANEITVAISKGVESAKKKPCKSTFNKRHNPSRTVCKVRRSKGFYETGISRDRTRCRWRYARSA